MMKKNLIAAAVAAVFLTAASAAMADDAPAAAAPAADAAAPAPSPLTFNVGVVSDYLFRGVSQTHGDPALQGGADYAFSNGFYVGTWLSTISWVKDWTGDGSVEWDLYGGYRGSFATDWTYDIGVIGYLYPGHGNVNPTWLANPNTTEVYGSIGYKWLSMKYSRAISPYFIGWYGDDVTFDKKTRGSNYLELNGTYDLGNGWGITGHVGRQKVENLSVADYTDWNVGVTKDVGFGIVGLKYSATSALGSCAEAATSYRPYCWGKGGNGDTNSGPTHDFTNVAKDKLIVTFLKTF